MATKIQIRRGLASSWSYENPTLASGEIGLETDTNYIKIGNGSSQWSSLPYFALPFVTSASASLVSYVNSKVAEVLDLPPGTLDTLNELAAAINDDPAFFTTISNSIVSASANAFSSASANAAQQILAASAIYVTRTSGSATYVAQDATGIEYIQDNAAALLNHANHTNVTATYNDAGNQILLNATIQSGNYLSASDAEIIPLDDISIYIDGMQNRFLPTYQRTQVSITNPLKLSVSINGIIQTVDFPEYVWQSMLPRRGLQVDSEGYLLFSEPLPQGSKFNGTIMAGPATTTRTKQYPFTAVDIMLGG
jgi:hypothetical protein